MKCLNLIQVFLYILKARKDDYQDPWDTKSGRTKSAIGIGAPVQQTPTTRKGLDTTYQDPFDSKMNSSKEDYADPFDTKFNQQKPKPTPPQQPNDDGDDYDEADDEDEKHQKHDENERFAANIMII